MSHVTDVQGYGVSNGSGQLLRRFREPAQTSCRVRERLGDRGAVAVELVVLVPVFALMLAFVLLVGRTQSSRADVEAAAHSAVRSITLSREPGVAAASAREDVAQRLGAGSSSCRSLGWDTTITSDAATVTVSCEVDLSEAALLPVPGTMTVSATSTEMFDRYMETRQ